MAVGIPLPRQGAAYFEVYRLDDIDASLRSLGLTLLVATSLTTIVAAALGYWASRYTLRPINRIGDAAEAVALGQLDTRLDYAEYAHDADLAPFVANFNGMVSALQERIDRDARFASDVSHELRSPLTTLNAAIQVLANDRDDMPERAQVALDLLSFDVERFTQLVEDLLEISRFDAGAVRLELDDVAIVPLVQMTVDNLTHGGVDVESDPQLDDVVIACDKRRLVRILANYLNNAEKYADGPTGVFVERVEPATDDPMGQTTVRISVEDRGSGVPEADAPESSIASTGVTRVDPAAPTSESGSGSPLPPNTLDSRADRCGSRIAMTAGRVPGSWSSCRSSSPRTWTTRTTCPWRRPRPPVRSPSPASTRPSPSKEEPN